MNEDTMETISHFICKNCLQIQIRRSDISMLGGEEFWGLIKDLKFNYIVIIIIYNYI
jgi:hypothetical protein